VVLIAGCFALAEATNVPEGDWGEVTALFFLPDGKTAIAARQDDKIHVYDVATGAERSGIFAHKEGVWAAVLAPDGKHFATGGGDNLVRLWDTATLKPIRTFQGHAKEVLAVAFAPDGKTLASGSGDRTIRTWDVASGKEIKSWHAHELKVLSLAYSPDGKTIASAGSCSVAIPGFVQGGTHADQVRGWDSQTGKELHLPGRPGTTVCFTPDGRGLAAAGYHVTGTALGGGAVTVNRGTSATFGPLGTETPWADMKNCGGTLAMSPDGRLLAVAYGSRLHVVTKPFGKYRGDVETDPGRISLWETATGKEIMHVTQDGVTVAALSPDGKKLAAGVAAGRVVFYDLLPEEWPYKAKGPQLRDKDMVRLWIALSEEPAEPAYVAICMLSAAAQPTIEFLQQKLQPEKAAAVQVGDLLNKLDSEKYAEREAAFRDLKKLGASAEAELRKALADEKSSAEVRKRLQKLLDGWEKRPASPAELQFARAVQVLERIGDSQARALLARLADGTPGSWQTEQARLALKRLQLR
jgi:dipeptidyl aminopeptidase/acylaminoacyl peptidase